MTASRPYATLSEAEKWQYHAHVYAFRRVYLDVKDEVRVWDGDLKGEWFDAGMVERETARLHRQRAKQDGSDKRQTFTFTDEERAERAEYARLRGYANWHEFLDAVHEATESVMPFLAWSLSQREAAGPPTSGTFIRLGAVLRGRPKYAEAAE